MGLVAGVSSQSFIRAEAILTCVSFMARSARIGRLGAMAASLRAHIQ